MPTRTTLERLIRAVINEHFGEQVVLERGLLVEKLTTVCQAVITDALAQAGAQE